MGDVWQERIHKGCSVVAHCPKQIPFQLPIEPSPQAERFKADLWKNIKTILMDTWTIVQMVLLDFDE